MPDPTHLFLLSPDRRVEIRFALGDWCADPSTSRRGAGRRCPDAPLWQVWFAGRQMLRRSLLGTAPLLGELEMVGVVRHRCRKTWQPAFGDAAMLDDHHNELVVRLRECAAPNRRLDLLFRCSNQGAAVRVRVPRQRGLARVTPTGASVLRMLDVHYAKLPPMRILKTGYGAGGHETPGGPNLLRLLVGEEDAAEISTTEPIAVSLSPSFFRPASTRRLRTISNSSRSF